jgi:hypothetical protein
MPQILIPLLAFIFGLGFPKSFSLLYLCLLVAVSKVIRAPSMPIPRSISIACICLIAFGVSYSVIQVHHGVWAPPSRFKAEIAAITLLPWSCLVLGWKIAPRRAEIMIKTIIAYMTGCLIYALLSLYITEVMTDDIPQNVLKVPWGNQQFLSVRAIEQRAFLSLPLLPLSCYIISHSKATSERAISFLMFMMGCLALVFTMVAHSRIGILVLLISSAPYTMFLHKRLRVGLMTIFTLAVAYLGSFTRILCDERVSLITNFINRMPQAPMGGRKLNFSYADCDPSLTNQFGSFAGSDAFSPHNVLLDIYNDCGIIPFIFILCAVFIVVGLFLSRYWRSLRNGDHPDVFLFLTWGVFSTLLVEWITQPFLYTDQLMFSLGFLFVGASLYLLSSPHKGPSPCTHNDVNQPAQ